MGDLITIDQNPGNTLLGSNSALFRFQSVSDLYFGNYFGPINHGLPIHWSNRHVRVHVECMELGTLHVTLQSSPQGGQELRALHANNNRGAILPWAFAGQLVQQFKLTLEDYGMDAKLIDAGYVAQAEAREQVEVTVSPLGNGELVAGLQLHQFHHGKFKRIRTAADRERTDNMVYHPHHHRVHGHRGSTDIKLELAPGMPLPDGPGADKRRPKIISSIRLDCQLQMSRRNDTEP